MFLVNNSYTDFILASFSHPIKILLIYLQTIPLCTSHNLIHKHFKQLSPSYSQTSKPMSQFPENYLKDTYFLLSKFLNTNLDTLQIVNLSLKGKTAEKTNQLPHNTEIFPDHQLAMF